MIDTTIGDLGIYWILKLLLISILYLCGWVITYRNPENKNFTFYAIVVAVTYSFVEGLRWNRGVDYHNYYLELLGLWKRKEVEPFYQFIVDICSSLFPYWFVFFLYSFLLITSFLLVVKRTPRCAVYALPLFFLITEAGAENLVRQFIGISFFLYGYAAFLKEKKCLACVLFAFVPLIHYSGLFAITLFVLFSILKLEEKMSKPWLLLGIYLVLYITWDVANLSEYVKFIDKLAFVSGTKFSGYIENSERWFTMEGSLSVINNTEGASSASIIFNVLINIVIIYYGFYVSKKDVNLRIPFWFAYCSIIISTIGGDIELYNRFVNWLYFFIPIVLGYVLVMVPFSKWERYVVYGIVFMAYAYPLLRAVGSMPYSGCSFVWDRI